MTKNGESPSKNKTETPSKNTPTTTPTKKVETTKASAKEKTHPPTSEMVNASLAALEEKNGSSLKAIKKYISATYKIDVEKHAVYIKKYLKSAVEQKIIIQTTGAGANGRFKLAADNTEKEKKKRGRKPAVNKSTDSDGAQ